MSVLNRDLDNVSNWFKANKLSLNRTKTNWIGFSGNKTPADLNILIDNVKIAPVKSTEFLGNEIDSHLSRNMHITKI